MKILNPSKLLNKEQHEELSSAIDQNSIIQWVSVAKGYITCPPSHNKWYKVGVGALIIVTDPFVSVGYIYIYDFDCKKIILEEEVYVNIKISKFRPWFLSFEGQNCLCGLNFVDPGELMAFYKNMTELIPKIRVCFKKRKPKGVDHKPKGVDQKTRAVDQKTKAADHRTKSNSNEKTWKNVFSSTKTNAGSTTATKKIQKTAPKQPAFVISGPTNFVHVSAIKDEDIPGYDSQNGFDIHEMDDHWLTLFSCLGLTEDDLTQPKIAKTIYKFVLSNGGIEQFIQSLNIKIEPNVKNQSEKTDSVKREGCDDDIRSSDSNPCDADGKSHPCPPPLPGREHGNSFSDEVSSARAALLDQIKNKNVAQKSVADPVINSNKFEENGLVNLLASRLQAMRSDDADDDDDLDQDAEETDDDNFWNDG